MTLNRYFPRMHAYVKIENGGISKRELRTLFPNIKPNHLNNIGRPSMVTLKNSPFPSCRCNTPWLPKLVLWWCRQRTLSFQISQLTSLSQEGRSLDIPQREKTCCLNYWIRKRKRQLKKRCYMLSSLCSHWGQIGDVWLPQLIISSLVPVLPLKTTKAD